MKITRNALKLKYQITSSLKYLRMNNFLIKKQFSDKSNLPNSSSCNTLENLKKKYHPVSYNNVDVYDEFRKNPIEKKSYCFRGRVGVVRKSSGYIFADIEVEPAKFLQIVLIKKDNDNENSMETSIFKFKAGDIIEFTGTNYFTKMNTQSILIQELHIITTTEQHFPKGNKHQGIKNPEVKFTKRYLDFIVEEKSKIYIIKRHEIISFIRNYFIERDFIEVETPILSNYKSGALALPFETKHNSLNKYLYLRVAPEIHLKMLIVSGFNKIFEIGKNFRNEDITPKHNPEFTSCEFYCAYWNYLDLLVFTKQFITDIFSKFYNESKESKEIIDYNNFIIIDSIELLEKLLKVNLKSVGEEDFNTIIDNFIKENHSESLIDEESSLAKTEFIIEEYVEKIIDNKPTFIVNFPVSISPLAKRNELYPAFAERFEFYINKIELINSYSELNEYKEQEQRFANLSKSNKLKNDKADKADKINKDNKADKEFVEALSYGMPPTGGWGVGIDRLVMMLLSVNNIKDIIAFPLINRRV